MVVVYNDRTNLEADNEIEFVSNILKQNGYGHDGTVNNWKLEYYHMRSIELNWLSKKDRWVILPNIQFITADIWSGSCYLPPYNLFTDKKGNDHYSKTGLLFINVETPGTIEAEMAHEWTHHLQYHSGTDFSELDLSIDSDELENDPDSFFAEYYARHHEREALLSECMRTHDENSRLLWFLTTGQTWKNTIK